MRQGPRRPRLRSGCKLPLNGARLGEAIPWQVPTRSVPELRMPRPDSQDAEAVPVDLHHVRFQSVVQYGKTEWVAMEDVGFQRYYAQHCAAIRGGEVIRPKTSNALNPAILNLMTPRPEFLKTPNP